MNSLSLDDVKTLPLDVVYAYALRHVRRLEQKRKHSQVYNTEPRVWQRNRTHYYQRRDIFHPVWNPNGSVEKRAKRVSCARGCQASPDESTSVVSDNLGSRDGAQPGTHSATNQTSATSATSASNASHAWKPAS
jgi:hypothetical protein